jgi:hypothetical protein
MEQIAARLAAIPGVVAVTLGGSRATGRHRSASQPASAKPGEASRP